MAACARCGEQSPPSANFCLACGAPFAARAPAPPSARKTVTVLFCDVADSTKLGEQLDPESLRGVMMQWFDAMRAVLERQGGTVEKFIGDAVMAVFGVPQVHEDDALRAAAAAAHMQAAAGLLSEKLERQFGLELLIRIGVNTGEVVAGDPTAGQALVTGDAVNVAKRLEQAAPAGGVLIGEQTRRLVANAVVVERAKDLSLKGRSQSVEAWRLVSVVPEAPAFARRLDSRLIGRERELALLRAELDGVAEAKTCRVVTVIGAAGIGKSRLFAELATVAKDAVVRTTRCLPYGDGITFWPLAQLVRNIGGEKRVREVLAREPDGELVAERLLGATDAGGEEGSSEETFWAVRRLLEAIAANRPLVLCVEDLHWAEPTFLDLLEYIAGWSRDSPILLLCSARPELLEERPGWRSLGTTMTLSPLTEQESETLLEELTVEVELSVDARERIREAAEGNPLFVEQMAAMLAEDGGQAVAAIPPTIQALLAARLDRLAPRERATVERAAVIGKEFSRGAVVELLDGEERSGLGTILLGLIRKDLIQPDRKTVAGDDTFRFRHVLVRDAAYSGMPKERRAELHERAAGWLEANEAGDELLGYHIEQAFRYREQLGLRDARALELAARAAELLARAGHRAFARDDMPAATRLLDRAAALAIESPPPLELERMRSSSLWSIGELTRADDLLDTVIARASASGDRREKWLARLEVAGRRTVTEPEGGLDDLLDVAEQAARVFDELGDSASQARAWRYISVGHRLRCRFALAQQASELALRFAARAGATHEEARLVDELCTALLYGPAPADEATTRCEQMLTAASESQLMEANVLSSLAGLRGLRAEFDEAQALARRARAIYEALGLRFAVAGLTQINGTNLLLAGDADAAERELREGFAIFAGVGARGLQAAHLAHALVRQERLEEAELLVAEAESLAGGSDVAPQILVRTARARLMAAGGSHDDALAAAAGAVELASETDALVVRADAELLHAEVLSTAGRQDDAAEAAQRAHDLYVQKQHLPGSTAAQARLSSLSAALGSAPLTE
ncbi:MAG: AAA family ATPase [Gaiellaceae bacterium]